MKISITISINILFFISSCSPKISDPYKPFFEEKKIEECIDEQYKSEHCNPIARMIVSRPALDRRMTESQGYGKIVLLFLVNKEGKVLKAEVQKDCSTFTEPELYKVAEELFLKNQFEEDDSLIGDEVQCGIYYITFYKPLN